MRLSERFLIIFDTPSCKLDLLLLTQENFRPEDDGVTGLTGYLMDFSEAFRSWSFFFLSFLFANFALITALRDSRIPVYTTKLLSDVFLDERLPSLCRSAACWFLRSLAVLYKLWSS